MQAATKQSHHLFSSVCVVGVQSVFTIPVIHINLLESPCIDAGAAVRLALERRACGIAPPTKLALIGLLDNEDMQPDKAAGEKYQVSKATRNVRISANQDTLVPYKPQNRRVRSTRAGSTEYALVQDWLVPSTVVLFD